jgi:hypothetical protein
LKKKSRASGYTPLTGQGDVMESPFTKWRIILIDLPGPFRSGFGRRLNRHYVAIGTGWHHEWLTAD